ncbi:MAG TPA: glycosyltransferase family 4 protein [Candidatus Hydrogenedentes bacterium]|nr:glycosyltransferase family 4 protein [Candidatus Hydrogenedentota bacterium]
MKRIRIAHVITRLCKGGAQENTFHTARLADRSRFEVDLISGPTSGREGTIEGRIQAAGIPIIREPMLVRSAAPMRDGLALGRLTRLFKRKQYDIVHTHTSKAGFIGRLAAARARVPIVVHTPHGNIFHGYFPRWLTRLFVWMERHAARRTDRIIALTAGGIEQHLAEGIGRREQYVSIFSGVDFDGYDAARARRQEVRRGLGCPRHAFLVGGIGRLEPIKGFSYFVTAAQSIAAALPETRFVLAGDGSLGRELRAQAAALGERFQFLGLRDDVAELMAAMDVCIVPSLNEGMGRVVLEAGAAGTPVVASNVGGIPDIVDDGTTGLLVPPRDAASIVVAVVALGRDPAWRAAMGAKARSIVVPNYGLGRMVERIEGLYEELIEEKGLDTSR